MTLALLLLSAQAVAEARATIVAPVVLRTGQIREGAPVRPRERPCGPGCRLIVFDLP